MKFYFQLCFFFFSTILFAQKTYRFLDINTMMWGVKDQNHQTVIQPTYKTINALKNGRYVVYNSSSGYGIIDENGSEIIPAEFISIVDENKDFIIVRKDGKVGVLNAKKDWILPLNYQDILKEEDFLIVRENNLNGIMDSNLKKTVPFIYNTIHFSNPFNNRFLVEKESKRGLIDLQNNAIIPTEYDYLSYIKAFDYYVGKQSKGGKNITKVFDQNGKVIFDTTNDGIVILAKNRFAVKNANNLWGIVDQKDKQKVNFTYKSILSSGSSEQIYIVQNQEDKWGGINDQGQMIIPFKYSESFYFLGDVAYVKNDTGKAAFIDKNGRKITEFIYEDVLLLNSSYYRVSVNQKKGLMDINGVGLIDPVYDYINAPVNRIVLLGKNKKNFIFNLDRFTVIPEVGYDYINMDDEQLILVKNNGLYGFIDYNGNVIVPIIYENAKPFTDHFASVTLHSENFIIDPKGNRVARL